MVHIKCYIYIYRVMIIQSSMLFAYGPQIVLCYNIQFHTGNLITPCTYAARGKAIALSFACLPLA